MRLIDADALLKTFIEKGIEYSVDVHNAIIDAEKPVAFICDGRACPQDCMECQHTTDITHAENFVNNNGRYMEKVRTGRWIAQTRFGESRWRCADCDAAALLDDNEQMVMSNFCPKCGLKMENADD